MVVDGSSLALLDGATVDFKDEMAKSAFIVSANPMSDASCGCGTSFPAKEVLYGHVCRAPAAQCDREGRHLAREHWRAQRESESNDGTKTVMSIKL